MKKTVLFECLSQLSKVYVYSEQQYLQASVSANSAVMKLFFEERALERDQFIEEIETVLAPVAEGNSGKTPAQLYEWHTHLYGQASLNNMIADMDILLIDEKALEICHCLLAVELPESLRGVLRTHLTKIEADLLSMVYLKSLFNN